MLLPQVLKIVKGNQLLMPLPFTQLQLFSHYKVRKFVVVIHSVQQTSRVPLPVLQSAGP